MSLTIQMYFLLFIIYSFLGWCLEVTCKLIEYKRFINRGFMVGPYCPIYGWGAVAITFLLYRYSYDPLVLFTMTTVTCCILEYLTSYLMEKLFKARWWDYSKRKFNINGRVCLGTAVPFGLFGLILTYIANPFLIDLLNKINFNTLNTITIILATIFSIDFLVSTFVIFSFRKTSENVNKEGSSDNTEQITEKVKAILLQKSWLHKRLIKAYPNLVAIKSKIKQIKDNIKENVDEVKTNLNDKKEDLKNNIIEKKQELSNTINEKKEDFKNKLKKDSKD